MSEIKPFSHDAFVRQVGDIRNQSDAIRGLYMASGALGKLASGSRHGLEVPPRHMSDVAAYFTILKQHHEDIGDHLRASVEGDGLSHSFTEYEPSNSVNLKRNRLLSSGSTVTTIVTAESPNRAYTGDEYLSDVTVTVSRTDKENVEVSKKVLSGALAGRVAMAVAARTTAQFDQGIDRLRYEVGIADAARRL